MPNVRVAQVGQTGLNRPIFEVVCGTCRFVFSSDGNGRLRLRNRSFLTSIGVYSSVANQFVETPIDELKTTLMMASDNTTILDDRFVVQSLGNGLAFVSDWSNATGWKNLAPVFSRTL